MGLPRHESRLLERLFLVERFKSVISLKLLPTGIIVILI